MPGGFEGHSHRSLQIERKYTTRSNRSRESVHCQARKNKHQYENTQLIHARSTGSYRQEPLNLSQKTPLLEQRNNHRNSSSRTLIIASGRRYGTAPQVVTYFWYPTTHRIRVRLHATQTHKRSRYGNTHPMPHKFVQLFDCCSNNEGLEEQMIIACSANAQRRSRSPTTPYSCWSAPSSSGRLALPGTIEASERESRARAQASDGRTRPRSEGTHVAGTSDGRERHRTEGTHTVGALGAAQRAADEQDKGAIQSAASKGGSGARASRRCKGAVHGKARE